MRYDFLTNLWRSEVWIGLAALAAFLVGVWVLRGAPPGQAGEVEDDEHAPRAGYRDRIVAGVVVGMLLILAGAYLALARGIFWSLPVFGAGFALVLALVAYNRRYRHASPSLRRTIEFSGAFLNATLLAGILIVANVIAFRYGGQPIDVTREGTYTLSDLSLKQLASLDRPVTFTVVFGRGPRAAPQNDRMIQLLESYKATNPQRIRVVTLDPYTDLMRSDELLKRVPDLDLQHGGRVVIEYGEGADARFTVVRSSELFSQVSPGPGRGGSDRFITTFRGEDEVTSALVRLREGKKSKVGFTAGHGEPAISDLNPRGRGVGNWKVRMAEVGCEVVDVPTLTEEVPKDLSLLIVAGPKTKFQPDEVQKLRAHVDRGGPLLLLVGNAEPSGLDELLKLFDLEIGKGMVFDPKYYYRQPFMVLAPLQSGAKHPIIDPLGSNRAVLLPGAAPITIVGRGPGSERSPGSTDHMFIPTPILQTTPLAWAETDPRTPPFRLDSGEKPGPVVVGVAVAERTASQASSGAEPTPRLVLFSCPAMAENAYQEIGQTNLDLLMNAVNWLRGKPDNIGISPHAHVALTLAIDPALRSRLILVPSVIAAMLIIAMGIIVYVARRE
jgi:ABC-type uncharacterized transport system